MSCHRPVFGDCMTVKGLLFVLLVTTNGFAEVDIIKKDFVKYCSKRLESVSKVLTSRKFVECAFHCMETNGCYAVNFKSQSKGNCELTSGLSQIQEMVDDVTSDLYIMDYNRCREEPNFCTNGATCEQSWTSARCHCADRYQGDRCSSCLPGYFDSMCNTHFSVLLQRDCNCFKDIHDQTDDTTDHEACKTWCANNATCSALVIVNDRCWFKDATCVEDVLKNHKANIYLKVVDMF